MSDLVRGRQDEDRSLGQVVMHAPAMLVVDVTLEDVRDALLSEVGVEVAFLTGGGDALREALEREERFPLPRREEDPSRDIGVVDHPMHEGHRSGFMGTGQETISKVLVGRSAHATGADIASRSTLDWPDGGGVPGSRRERGRSRCLSRTIMDGYEFIEPRAPR